ncbi:MAG: c-type cytochrome [Pedosphaera sp.]|nr:c-type cytochrome [Pedosphaera sp.]
MKLQIPNSKLQRNFNLQAPNSEPSARRHLKFWVWCFSGAWMLVLGAFPASAVDGPLTPEDALKYLKTEPGLRVELVVAEPVVVDPVAVAWDERGRMFVVEDRGYPVGPGKGQKPVGQVVLLEDTDGDGKYDKRMVFADGLTFPNGVMPWKGGVYVTCAPYLYYFKDTNDDGVADVKEIVFKGFQDLSTTQLRVSHPTLALDNWVYLTSGLTAAKVTSPSWTNREPVFLNRVDGRFRPGTHDIEPTSGAAQFGQTFDAFGQKFICSNRNHIQHVVMPQRYLQRNPNLSFSQLVEDIPDHGAACKLYPLSANIVTAAFHGGYVTSACGVTIYNGTGLPDEYRGNSFTCEPAGNLVHHDVLTPDGVTFVAKRAYPTNEFLASPDNWFRPVNLAVGPDGALYVCDMYRKTIEHPEYLPEATRKVTDFESGKGMGRIYRVVADKPNTRGREKYSVFSVQKALAGANVKQLCAALENSNAWWRMTAHRLLLERRDLKAVPFLEQLARARVKPAAARIQAMHLLAEFGALRFGLFERLFADPDPEVCEHAIKLAEARFAKSPALVTRVLEFADDPNPRVRFQCALSLGESDDDRVVPALVNIATHNLEDKWTRAAVLSSIANREDKFLQALLPVATARSSAGFPVLVGELGRILGASQPQPKLFPVLRELLSANRLEDLAWQMAAVGGFGDGLRARGRGSKETPALLSLVNEDSSNLRAQVDKLFARSGELASDASRPLGDRLAAVSLLAEGDSPTAGGTLEKLIEPQQPVEIQSAAVRALGRMVPADKASVFVQRARWNAYTPTVRDMVLTVLTANANLLSALFTAIEAGDVPAWTVNADRRNQLMHHKDETIKARAEKLFKDLTPGDRMKVYEETKSVLTLTGNGTNGHAMFQKNCITCHTFSGEGKQVGPDLTGIRNQPAEVILLHLVVPEYEINPIYTAYNVETKGGESYAGLLAAETPASITLRMAQGIEQQVPRGDIASMTTSRLSLMPQELEKAMTKQELADLLAFLKGL